jgi:hypothetical protein
MLPLANFDPDIRENPRRRIPRSYLILANVSGFRDSIRAICVSAVATGTDCLYESLIEAVFIK